MINNFGSFFHFKMNRFINAGIHFFILYLIYREIRLHFRYEDDTTRRTSSARGKSQEHDFDRLMGQPETELGQSKEFLVKVSVWDPQMGLYR